jgi:peptidase A4-like protein
VGFNSDCRGGFLQAGVTSGIHPDGRQSASAWIEWYPAPVLTIDIRMAVGDPVFVFISAQDKNNALVSVLP